MAMAHTSRQFHPLPVIGHPEAWYTKHIAEADAAGDKLAHASHKVGQYVTLALDPHRSWEEKAKYFRHTLKHHCVAPHDADPQTQAFCEKLRALVVRYASLEALRVARQEHDGYAIRAEMGESRDALADEAEVFFPTLLGHGACPEFLSPDCHAQIRALRDRWI